MTRKGKVQLQGEITTNLADNSNRDISAEDVRNVATNITDSMIFPGSGVVADFAVGAIVIESEGIGSNDNDTTIPTSAAVKDYVDGSTSAGTIATGTWEATDVAVAHGGTGASTASSARTNLGVAIGSNVQAYDAQLGTLAALTANQVGGLVDLATLEAPASDGQFIVATGAGVFAYENGSTARTSLGLGNVENTALSTWVGTTNITTLGTIATGTWQGTAIARTYIAADAINGDKIDDDSVDSEHYAAGSIDEEHLNASNSPTDNYVLSYHSATGGFTWVAAGAGEANESSFKTISVSGQDNVVADTTTDTLTFAAGSNITITTTAASDTVTIAAADTNTMGSGFTVSATTDSNATTITQGDDLMFTAGTGITCETTADGTVTITNTVSNTNTMGSGFVLEDGDGTEVTITENKEVKFIEGAGIDIDWTDVSDGSDGDPYDLTFTVDHDAASNFVANEHIDWTASSAGTIHSSNYTDTNTTYTKASFDLDHLFTLVDATADTSEHLGTFTGSTISDSVTIKAALQALETAVETKGATAGSSSIVTTGALDSGSITSGFGNIDNGGSSIACGSLDVSDGNVTNVGDIDCDSISIADAATGLDIVFGGNTTLNKMTLTDNLADALNVTEASNSYIKICTTNGSTGNTPNAEKIHFGQAVVGATNTATDGGAVTIDCSKGNYHEILMNATATSIVFTNAAAGQRIVVRFKQHSSHIDLDANAGWDTVTVNGSSATVTWPGGTIPTLTETNNAIDVYGFIFQSTVTNVHAFIIGQALA